MLKNFFSGISGSGKGNDFVGQYVELGQQKLRIRRVLGEGRSTTKLGMIYIEVSS